MTQGNDLSRRKALGILGLAAVTAYLTPTVLPLSSAEAGWRTDRSRRRRYGWWRTDRYRRRQTDRYRRRTDRYRRRTDRRRTDRRRYY